MGNKATYPRKDFINGMIETIEHKRYNIEYTHFLSNLHSDNYVVVVPDYYSNIDNVYNILVTINSKCNVNVLSFNYCKENISKYTSTTYLKNSCYLDLCAFMECVKDMYKINTNKLIFCCSADSVNIVTKYMRKHCYNTIKFIVTNPRYKVYTECCKYYNTFAYKNTASVILSDVSIFEYILAYCEDKGYKNIEVISPSLLVDCLANKINKLIK